MPPHWVPDGQTVAVTDAPTILGGPVGYQLRHDASNRAIDFQITQSPSPTVYFIYPCRFGRVDQLTVDGRQLPVTGDNVTLPANTTRVTIGYR